MNQTLRLSFGLVGAALAACLLVPLLALIALIVLPDLSITAPTLEIGANAELSANYTFSDGVKLGLIGCAGSRLTLLIAFPILLLMFYLTLGRMVLRAEQRSRPFYLWTGIICMMLAGGMAFIIGTLAFNSAAGLGAYLTCSGVGLLAGLSAAQLFCMIVQPKRRWNTPPNA